MEHRAPTAPLSEAHEAYIRQRIADNLRCDGFRWKFTQGDVVALLAELDRLRAAEATVQALRAALEKVARDVATVRTVAERRSNPDNDHRQMLVRLKEWETILLAAIPADQELC